VSFFPFCLLFNADFIFSSPFLNFRCFFRSRFPKCSWSFWSTSRWPTSRPPGSQLRPWPTRPSWRCLSASSPLKVGGNLSLASSTPENLRFIVLHGSYGVCKKFFWFVSIEKEIILRTRSFDIHSDCILFWYFWFSFRRVNYYGACIWPGYFIRKSLEIYVQNCIGSLVLWCHHLHP